MVKWRRIPDTERWTYRHDLPASVESAVVVLTVEGYTFEIHNTSGIVSCPRYGKKWRSVQSAMRNAENELMRRMK